MTEIYDTNQERMEQEKQKTDRDSPDQSIWTSGAVKDFRGNVPEQTDAGQMALTEAQQPPADSDSGGSGGKKNWWDPTISEAEAYEQLRSAEQGCAWTHGVDRHGPDSGGGRDKSLDAHQDRALNGTLPDKPLETKDPSDSTRWDNYKDMNVAVQASIALQEIHPEVRSTDVFFDKTVAEGFRKHSTNRETTTSAKIVLTQNGAEKTGYGVLDSDKHKINPAEKLEMTGEMTDEIKNLPSHSLLILKGGRE